ncbi:MAG: valine--tRNA ligase [Catalinimonas sp.]
MLAKTYDPTAVEDKWYQYWMDQRLFESHPNPDKEPYTILIPPPNVTGVLHMGHMLNNTIQDVLVRRARMLGKEACWVPGTDHASIATEAKVVAMLRERGIDKRDLSREEFMEHAWAWKEKYGGIILKQLRKLGASCDWRRTRFTMEDDMSRAVGRVFVDLYRKGHIYRGVRMVNWDPVGRTAVSDEEVNHRPVDSQLCYLRYPVVGGDGHVVVATVRPETIMADVAVCVHPDDDRYRHLHGGRVRIPLVDREIPVITDPYVTMDFGTGVLKITPAHDPNDFELGRKHGLPTVDILNEDATLHERAGRYVGQDRFAARKAIIKDLEAAGLMEKREPYASNVGFSERTDAVIEPRLSPQWFVRMKALAAPALAAVEDDTVRLIPDKFKNLYRHWMENVHDWCISRQLWWGQQIPAWYLPADGGVVVAETEAEALAEAQRQYPNLTAADLRRDPDVVDTWFSSWLWPMTVFGGFEDSDNADVRYYYPTNDLVTAPEILFFWVARMVMAGLEYRGEVPFRNVYLTGIVRDAQRRKMSKSLGNSPDPLDLIGQYGADAVRTGMLFSSPAGNDLLYEERLVEQGRNFCNKLWNAYRLLESWQVDPAATPATDAPTRWFGARLAAAGAQMEAHFADYRMSDALLQVYGLAWNDYCSSYLEMIKPDYGERIDAPTHRAALNYFEVLLRLLHPFMPFITEELWQVLAERPAGASICVAPWPEATYDAAQHDAPLADGEVMQEVITQVRNLRSGRGLSPKEALPLLVRTDHPARYETWGPVLRRLLNLSELRTVDAAKPGALSFVVKTDELFVPVAGGVDLDAERARTEKELAHQEGFLRSVMKKLGNERFVQNAKPEVVERERQKQADAEAKVRALREGLARLEVPS